MRPLIEAHGLTKDFGKGRGIIDLDLEVRPGEIFGLLGPNGAGKTTVIRLLLDLLRPTRGQARVHGLDARREGLHIRRHVGYLPGELELYPTLRGRQLIERIAGLRGGIDREAVDRLADRLDADLDRPVGQLSSGNKQKIGLIVAFMHDPDLLILDEPVTGLDPLMQREVQAMILEAKKRGKTVFLSSHNLPEVERLCDRVAIIREGRLLTVKTLDELRGHDVNRLIFRFAQAPPPDIFTGLPHVDWTEVHGRVARVVVRGPVDAVVKAAAEHTVLDVDSQDPGLEEAFLRYYRGAGPGVQHA